MAGLLERAIEAHGGAARFEAAEQIHARVRSGGFALASKGKRKAVADFQGHVSTKHPRSVVDDFPEPGQRGVFEPERVWIESDSGERIAERSDARAQFRKLRRQLWWDDLDLAYFAGYALWNYLCAPFLFTRPGFEAREEHGSRLRVVFPPDIPTHSREQLFYFDADGLLTRLDYTAEVFGKWAKAAHLCAGHRTFDGIVFPTRRRVYPRRPNGRPLPRPTLVRIDLESISLS